MIIKTNNFPNFFIFNKYIKHFKIFIIKLIFFELRKLFFSMCKYLPTNFCAASGVVIFSILARILSFNFSKFTINFLFSKKKSLNLSMSNGLKKKLFIIIFPSNTSSFSKLCNNYVVCIYREFFLHFITKVFIIFFFFCLHLFDC